jgi:hypothetical protein
MQRFERVLDLLPSGHVFDGELVVLDDAGRPLFNELLFGRGHLTYVTLDLPLADGIDLRPLPLKQRKAALAWLGERAEGWIPLTDGIVGEGRALFRAVVDADLEGIVAKRLTEAYHPKLARWYKIINAPYSQRRGRSRSTSGYLAQKLWDDLAREQPRRVLVRIDPQRSGGRSAHVRKRVERVVEVLKHWAEMGKQPCSSLGGGDASGSPVEEADTEVPLQAKHGVAQGRARDAERVRCFPKAAVTGDGGERSQVIEAGAAHW